MGTRFTIPRLKGFAALRRERHPSQPQTRTPASEEAVPAAITRGLSVPGCVAPKSADVAVTMINRFARSEHRGQLRTERERVQEEAQRYLA